MSRFGLLFWSVLALPGPSIGQIVVAPASPMAVAGQSIAITADRPVSFSLAGAGSISSGTGTTVTYTAPSQVSNAHVLNGCMVLPPDSVFNTPIDQLPVNANSDTWVPYLFGNGLQLNYEWGQNLTSNTTPTTLLNFHYTAYLNNTPFPNPNIASRNRQTGAYPTDANNDHHMVSVNKDTCQIAETYQQDTVNQTWTAASGLIYSESTYSAPYGSTDAAGLPLTPLVIHLSEIKEGAIHHAVRFTGCAGCISPQWLWPASYSTGGGAIGSAPPMGARFRLKKDFDISGFPASAQVVLTALKTYGMIVADIDNAIPKLSLSTDVVADKQVYNDLQSIPNANLSGSDFEAVDESSLMVDTSSTRANPSNPYQPIPNSAVVTVTDLANPANSVQVPIALRPVTVGVPEGTMAVQAGAYSMPLQYWVKGSANTTVVWSIEPASGAGTISADGQYTPPASVGGIQQATVTATSVADPTAHAAVTITIIPAGTIRIDTGSSQGTQDANGNNWLPDLFIQTASNQPIVESPGQWGTGPLANIYSSYVYTWGDDIVYKLHVPNGTYNVGLLFGLGNSSGQTYDPTSIFDDGLIWGSLNIELQGQIAMPNWDPGAATNHLIRAANLLTLPTVVTDTTLEIGVRATGGSGYHSAPFLNGLTITPAAVGITSTPSSTATSQSTSTSGLASPPSQPAPIAGAYGYSAPVTIHHSQVPNTDQVNFPLWVSGTYPYLATAANGGSVQNANGYDIVFASDSAGVNRLPFERSAYDPTTGNVRFWVQVPTLSHTSDTTIYMLYGNPSITTDQSSKTATWNSNYKAVWHMDEQSGTTLYDSTANANHASKADAGEPAAATGIVGGAQLFNNTTFTGSSSASNFAITGASPSTDLTSNGISISAIVNANAWNTYGAIYKRTATPSDSVTSSQVAVTVNESGGDLAYWVNGSMVADFPKAYALNTWAFVTVTHDFSSGIVSFYNNGVLLGTRTTTAVPSSAPNDIDVIGNRAYGSGTHTFPGALDEIMVSNTALSGDWLAATYNNQSQPVAFYSVH